MINVERYTTPYFFFNPCPLPPFGSGMAAVYLAKEEAKPIDATAGEKN